MPQQIKTLIRDYFDGKISRRDFIRKTMSVAGGFVAAQTLLERFARDQAYGAEVEPNDPAIRSDNIEFSGKSAKLIGYSAWPSSPGKYPAVIVIHANQGLNDYTRDVARRLAKQGYVALALDYLSRHGGTQKVNPKGEGLGNIRELEPWQAVAEDTDGGYSYLKTLPSVKSNRLGLIGFCWGGEMTFSSATEVRGLNAVVVFYGRSPKPLERLEKIQAPMLAHYGEKDPGVNQDIPATEQAMKQYHKSYTYKIYPGAQHGFHSDTSPERYHPEAAKEAWSKTLEFFRQHLQS
jgi:carboxymethylenebutenolidase